MWISQPIYQVLLLAYLLVYTSILIKCILLLNKLCVIKWLSLYCLFWLGYVLLSVLSWYGYCPIIMAIMWRWIRILWGNVRILLWNDLYNSIFILYTINNQSYTQNIEAHHLLALITLLITKNKIKQTVDYS